MDNYILQQDILRLQNSVNTYKQIIEDYAANCKNLLNQIKERDEFIKELAQSRNEYADKAISLQDDLILALKKLNAYEIPNMN
jgi:hypothetical protein